MTPFLLSLERGALAMAGIYSIVCGESSLRGIMEALGRHVKDGSTARTQRLILDESRHTSPTLPLFLDETRGCHIQELILHINHWTEAFDKALRT